MSKIQVEVDQRTMLETQSSKSGTINLSSQILEEEPGRAGTRAKSAEI